MDEQSPVASPTPVFPASADQAQIVSATQVFTGTISADGQYFFPINHYGNDHPIYQAMGQGQGPSWVLEPRSLGPALDAARTPPRLTDQQLWKLMDSGIINLLFETINCDDAPDGEVCSLKYEAQLDYITALLQEQLEHFRSSTTLPQVVVGELKMGPIVQVIRLFELTNEEKQRPGMVKWHGEMPEEITHEGWISDGVHALHAWFHRACFSRSRINLPLHSTTGTPSTVVHEKAVVELVVWDYHGFGSDPPLWIKPADPLDPEGLYSG